MILHANKMKIECDTAIKGDDYITVFKNNKKICEFLGITNFSMYSVEDGEFSAPELDDITQLQLAIAELADIVMEG